ncbi:MAG: VOC family protein [Longimicrobiales bacterium]
MTKSAGHHAHQARARHFKAGIVVDDYDRTLATLRERGVSIVIGPFPARDGQRANVIIRDEAGICRFFERR